MASQTLNSFIAVLCATNFKINTWIIGSGKMFSLLLLPNKRDGKLPSCHVIIEHHFCVIVKAS